MVFFELFELTPAYRIDTFSLGKKFLSLQTAAHPDKFVSGTDAQRRAAEQRSALINDAYATLIDPVNRAAYLIESKTGEDPFAQTNTKMPRDFLQKQVDLREALEEHRANKNSAALVSLYDELETVAAETEKKLAIALDEEHDMIAATSEARKLKFQQKLLEQINAEIG